MSSDEYTAMDYLIRNVRDYSFYEEIRRNRSYGDYIIKNYLTENWIDVNLTREGIQSINTNNFIDELLRLFYLSV